MPYTLAEIDANFADLKAQLSRSYSRDETSLILGGEVEAEFKDDQRIFVQMRNWSNLRQKLLGRTRAIGKFGR